MALSKKRRAQMVAANQQEYPEGYACLNFPPAKELEKAETERAKLLSALAGRVEFGCSGTKLDMRNLSPGCQRCVAGRWSCLFINGRCNCDCFYCPTSQEELGVPTTNSISFCHPADYVRYLERFGFSGASLSGGEPLLTSQRSLGFLSAIKRRFGTEMHCWLYTNGTLASADLLMQLRDAGLDEIRFDIGATGYQLKALERAVGIIPTVTVEIPAIPEETGRLKSLLGVLLDTGVAHLNLHQLRLTPYNYRRLQPRGYRFLHGEKVTVLDSELAALKIMLHGTEQVPGLPINYCSFVYKKRFQGLAARQRNATVIGKGYEALTENGYIRSISLFGDRSRLAALLKRFCDHGVNSETFSLSRSGEQLSVHPMLWPLVEPGEFRLQVSYFIARQLSSVTYRNPFTTIELSSRQKLIVERSRTAEFTLDEEQAALFGRIYLLPGILLPPVPEKDLWEEIALMERPRSGLQEYY